MDDYPTDRKNKRALSDETQDRNFRRDVTRRRCFFYLTARLDILQELQMTVSMFTGWFGSILLLVKLCCHVGLGYNVDTEFPQIFRGPSGSRFGVTAEIVKTVSNSWQVYLYQCKQCIFSVYIFSVGRCLENSNFINIINCRKLLLPPPPFQQAYISPTPLELFWILEPRMFYLLVSIIFFIRKGKKRILQCTDFIYKIL